MDATAPDGALERETIITTFQRGYLGKLRRDPRFTEKPGGTEAHGIFTIERNRWAPTTGAKRNVQLSDARKAELAARLHAHRSATVARENK